jgi:hypothetical protein
LCTGLIELFEEIVHLLFGHILGDAVVLLNPADELLALPIDHIQVIVREFPPSSL